MSQNKESQGNPELIDKNLPPDAIDDVELAFEMARAENPLREFAIATLVKYGSKEGYDIVTQSAIDAGESAGLRFIEKREKEDKRVEKVLQLGEIEQGKEVIVTRSDLVACAKENDFTLPRAYDAFNRIVDHSQSCIDHELGQVVSD